MRLREMMDNQVYGVCFVENFIFLNVRLYAAVKQWMRILPQQYTIIRGETISLFRNNVFIHAIQEYCELK